MSSILVETSGIGHMHLVYLRDDSGACCGENRPDTYAIGYVARDVADIMIRLKLAMWDGKPEECPTCGRLK